MITIIAGVISVILYHRSVISAIAVCVILSGAIISEFIASGLYFKFGFLKTFYHGMLGWHTPDDSEQYHVGCSQHARCKYCGKDIMRDSQGNWF